MGTHVDGHALGAGLERLELGELRLEVQAVAGLALDGRDALLDHRPGRAFGGLVSSSGSAAGSPATLDGSASRDVDLHVAGARRAQENSSLR